MKVQPQRILKVLLLFGILVVSGIFHVWIRTKVVTIGYLVAQARNEISEIESKISQTKLRRAREMSAENSEKVSARLKEQGIIFHDPRPEQLIYIRENSNESVSKEVPSEVPVGGIPVRKLVR